MYDFSFLCPPCLHLRGRPSPQQTDIKHCLTCCPCTACICVVCIKRQCQCRKVNLAWALGRVSRSLEDSVLRILLLVPGRLTCCSVVQMPQQCDDALNAVPEFLLYKANPGCHHKVKRQCDTSNFLAIFNIGPKLKCLQFLRTSSRYLPAFDATSDCSSDYHTCCFRSGHEYEYVAVVSGVKPSQAKPAWRVCLRVFRVFRWRDVLESRTAAHQHATCTRQTRR